MTCSTQSIVCVCVCVCVGMCVCACICVTRLNFPHAGILQDRAKFSTLFLRSHKMFYSLLDKCRKCEEMSHFGKQNIQGISFLVQCVCNACPSLHSAVVAYHHVGQAIIVISLSQVFMGLTHQGIILTADQFEISYPLVAQDCWLQHSEIMAVANTLKLYTME